LRRLIGLLSAAAEFADLQRRLQALLPLLASSATLCAHNPLAVLRD
jgi:hypothetical protein